MTNDERLTLDEAYQATFLWLDHAEDPPLDISEPSHGSVELVTERSFVRVRSSDGPVEQSSVLALLRAAEAGKKLLIFSPSGFSPGAISIAETQGIGLFTLDRAGRAIPETTHARAIAPSTEPDPPFAPKDQEDEHEAFWNRPQPSFVEDPVQDTSVQDDGIGAGTLDWSDCPSCGTTHHRNAKFCRECGMNLQSGSPAPFDTGAMHATPVAQDAGEPKLRCRTCGSHNIELLE
jgi:hypothetical protein